MKVKKIICVTRKEIADQIAEELSCKYMIQNLGETEVYSFIETDKLYKILSNKSKYSRKEWYYDNRLRF